MRGRVVVIPHGEYGSLARTGGSVDRDSARAALGIEPQTPVTLLFGQLREDKGLKDLLEAASRAASELTLIIGARTWAPSPPPSRCSPRRARRAT